MQWRFHQFDATIGEVVLKLLNHLPPGERGSVTKAARHFSIFLAAFIKTQSVFDFFDFRVKIAPLGSERVSE